MVLRLKHIERRIKAVLMLDKSQKLNVLKFRKTGELYMSNWDRR